MNEMSDADKIRAQGVMIEERNQLIATLTAQNTEMGRMVLTKLDEVVLWRKRAEVWRNQLQQHGHAPVVVDDKIDEVEQAAVAPR